MVDKELLFSLATFVVSLTLLFILRKLLLGWLRKLTQDYWEIVLKIIRFPSLLWVVLISLYLTLRLYPPSVIVHGAFLEKVFMSLLILSLTLFFANLTSELLRFYISKTSIRFPQTGIIFAIAKFLIVILGVISLLSFLGVPVVHFITTLGIGGLAISLAIQGTLSNFFSGLNIIASRQIEVGDFIKLENGEEGYVEDITWMNTVIRRRDNNLVIIPNSKLVNSIAINYHKPTSESNLIIPLSVSYFDDLEKVEKVTVKIAREIQKEIEGADPNFEPFIRYISFGDSGINFNVVLRVLDPDAQFIVRHQFIKRIKKAYEEEGIEIPFPVRRIYISDERS
ncbi:mechanosensitive ion channel family protein [Thermocrinis sp.]|uniref:mechanosensitive ion channel family protein n=1 Tax=Thermocrinis sp. TaxID=2024383 RepID=UPI002FDD3272